MNRRTFIKLLSAIPFIPVAWNVAAEDISATEIFFDWKKKTEPTNREYWLGKNYESMEAELTEKDLEYALVKIFTGHYRA